MVWLPHQGRCKHNETLENESNRSPCDVTLRTQSGTTSQQVTGIFPVSIFPFTTTMPACTCGLWAVLAPFPGSGLCQMANTAPTKLTKFLAGVTKWPHHTAQVQLATSQTQPTTQHGERRVIPLPSTAKCPTGFPVASSPQNMCCVALGHMKISVSSPDMWLLLVSCTTYLFRVGCPGGLLSWMHRHL